METILLTSLKDESPCALDDRPAISRVFISFPISTIAKILLRRVIKTNTSG